jgi:hypothetical protein
VPTIARGRSFFPATLFLAFPERRNPAEKPFFLSSFEGLRIAATELKRYNFAAVESCGLKAFGGP